MGPRRSIGGFGFKDVEESKRSPHIFISRLDLPTKPNFLTHLQGLLKASKPKRILFDHEGWYFAFEDSSAGREALERCHRRCHRQYLFSEYELVMQRLPYGVGTIHHVDRDDYQHRNANRNPQPQSGPSATSPTNNVRVKWPETTDSSRIAGQDLGTPSSPQNQRIPQSKTPNHVAPPGYPPIDNHARPTSSAEVVASQLFRSDCDDTNSLTSGVAPSDGSRSKRLRCHVCQGDAAPGHAKLVRCSTCPRRYHSRCHKEPSIPSDLPGDHTWRCRSCVKKGKTGEVKKPNGGVSSSAAQSSASTKEQTILEGPEAGPRDHQSQAGATSEQRIKTSNDIVMPDKNDSPAVSGTPSKDQTLLNAKLLAKIGANGVNDVPLTSLSDGEELDELVKASFAEVENQLNSGITAAPRGKPFLARTKLTSLTPQTVANQPETGANTIHPQQSVRVAPSNRHLPSNTTQQSLGAGDIARPSAANLRALALNRHQSTTANNIDKQPTDDNQHQQSSNQSPELNPLNSSAVAHLGQLAMGDGASDNHEPAEQGRATTVSSVASGRMEIPESPDDVRNGVSKSHEAAGKRPHATTKLSSQAPVSATKQPLIPDSKPVDAGLSGKKGAVKGQKGSSTAECQKCRKKIPPDPSGQNRLCTSCKRDLKRGSLPLEAQALYGAASPADMNKAASKGADPSQQVNQAAEASHAIPPPKVTPAQSAESFDKYLQSLENDTQRRKKRTHEQTKATRDNNILCSNGITGDKSGAQTRSAAYSAREEGSKLNRAAPESAEALPKRSQFCQKELSNPGDSKKHTDAMPMDRKKTAISSHSVSEGRSPKGQAVQDAVAAGPTIMESNGTIISPKKLERIKAVVGDSSDRPVGSRALIVGMALCSAPDYRLSRESIIEWIDANIPTYKLGEGNWKARIVSQLTQGKETASGGGYWREEESQQGQDGSSGQKWYQLLPGKEEEMYRWCPVLKEPLAPQRETKLRGGTKKRQPSAQTKKTASTNSVASTLASAPESARGSSKDSAVDGSDKATGENIQAANAEEMDVDVPPAPKVAVGKMVADVDHQKRNRDDGKAAAKDQGSPSDDEPLSKKRRQDDEARVDSADRGTVRDNATSNVEMDELPDAADAASDSPTITALQDSHDINEGILEGTSPSHQKKRSRMATLPIKNLRRSPAPKKASNKSHSNTGSLSTAFHDEWPEYKGENSFDRQEKLAEISKRPSRKEMFGKPASQSRLRPKDSTPDSPFIPTNFSPAKRQRAPVNLSVKDLYPWENPDIDPTRKEYKTLEEFFDLPANMIPIISDGQLAYRDGTRTDDGRLPRAREIFKP